MGKTWVLSTGVVLLVGLTANCVDSEEPARSANAPAAAASPFRLCPRTYVVDDMEDDNNQVIPQLGRSGYWYTFADKGGTTIEPAAGGHFSPSLGGANGSAYAARASGAVAPSGAPLFAGLGFSITDPKGPYDASAYSGITFVARVGPGSSPHVRLKVPDIQTDPEGHRCSECFNDFGADLVLSETWRRYTVAFDRMTQMEGWGSPRPSSIDMSKIFGVQWQVTQPGTSYEVWVDDVAFTGCP
jgi:endoglucanase